MVLKIFIVLAASAAAHASQTPILIPDVPLPGYGYGPSTATVIAPNSDGPFPSAFKIFGATPDPLNALSVPDEDLRDAVAEPMTTQSLLTGLRSPSVSTRLANVRASTRPLGVKAVPYLTGVMLRLNEPVQVRAAAALALGQIGDEIAFDALSEALKDPSPYVRYASALSLGSLEVDGVTTRLERVLRRDAAWQPRYAAAISIGRTRKSFAIPSLTQALRHDLAWQVRQQAARSLQDIGTPAAAQSLASALADPEPSVRAAAGAALMEIGGLEDRRAVSDALRIENNPSVRTVWSNAQRRFLSKP